MTSPLGDILRAHRGTAALLTFAMALAAATPAAQALPMGSQGTWMLMVDTAADSAEIAVNYALTRTDAVGAMAGRWEEMPHTGAPANHAQRRDFAGLNYTRLLHRWNLPHAQANLWLVGGLGGLQARERSGTDSLWTAAGLADYETTRVYVGGGWELMRSGTLRHDTGYARAGFSFYEAEYEEIQPWFVLEAKRERFTAETKSTTTAMLRLIHKRYFVELGANRDGAVFNLMFNY